MKKRWMKRIVRQYEMSCKKLHHDKTSPPLQSVIRLQETDKNKNKNKNKIKIKIKIKIKKKVKMKIK